MKWGRGVGRTGSINGFSFMWVSRLFVLSMDSIRSSFFIQIDASNVSWQLSVGALAGTPSCSQCVWCFALLPSFSFVGALSGHGRLAFDGCEHRRPLRCDPSGSICPWAHGPTGPWAHGTMGPWAHRPMGPRAHRPIGPWGPWALGPMGPWAPMGARRRPVPPTVRSQYSHGNRWISDNGSW